MKTTRICAVICASTTEAALAAMKRAAAGAADLVEIRADYIEDVDVHRLLSCRALPVIFTCRPARAGGRFTGPEIERLALLRHALQAGADFVDVEEDADVAAAFANLDPDHAILSYHNFKETPTDLEAIYQRLKRRGAGTIKMATQANSFSDAVRLFDLLRQYRRQSPNLIVCAMGPRGQFTRLLGPWSRSFLTYASLEEGRESADGQIPLAEMVGLYRVQSLDSTTKVIGLLGTPLAHSLSPAVHNAAFHQMALASVYIPFDADDVSRFMELADKLPLAGLSVTAPHKTNVLPLLDSMDATAKAVGAVNTCVRTERGWVGYNTDVEGCLSPLLAEDSPTYRTAVIVGAGGAARAAALAMRRLGVSIRIVHRRLEKARALAEEIGAAFGPPASLREKTDLLINATPVGMYPNVSDTPIPREYLRGYQAVYDLVYNPYRTRLLEEAKAEGLRTIHGLEMFLAQAALQFRIWTGQPAPIEIMRKIAIARLRESGKIS
ncbi:MAG: shikimate dehydrogenase [Acidobacteria bacterium]|nr:shikimate dehydrogenase [Acidobacteriota bacterium]MBI3657114.1 shikimate dehydrogenase [Acidobacteriota bacterium]